MFVGRLGMWIDLGAPDGSVLGQHFQQLSRLLVLNQLPWPIAPIGTIPPAKDTPKTRRYRPGLVGRCRKRTHHCDTVHPDVSFEGGSSVQSRFAITKGVRRR